MTEQACVVQSRGLSVRFGETVALTNVSLDVARGAFVSLIGPSGCGKTTLLRCIADLEQPAAGSLLVDGISPEAARKRRAYGYVFQAPALYPWRNAAANVALPLEIMGVARAERRQRAAQYLRLVGLEGFARRYPWQLSGGMQQRVSIARALSFRPSLLLMDEPFGALDEITRDGLNLHLHRLWRDSALTVIFVTHSIPEAVFLSTRIVVMSPRPGRVAAIIDSDLPLARDLDIRDAASFVRLSHTVREALRAGHDYDRPE